jgi:hypothetical protein
MRLRFEHAVRAAESGVRAARKSVSHALDNGQATARRLLDDSERHADASLSTAERALIGVMGAIAERGRGYAKTGKHRLYEAEARVFPRRPTPRIGTAVVALGAGVLLSLLFRPARAADPARNSARTQPPLLTTTDL